MATTTNLPFTSLPPLPAADDHRRPPPPPPSHHHHLLRLAATHHSLPLLKLTHASLLKTPSHPLPQLTNSLISAYLALNLLSPARTLLAHHSAPDAFSFTALISAYSKSHHFTPALHLFHQMRLLQIPPTSHTFVALIANIYSLGPHLHALALKSHQLSSLHVANAIIGMYVKCDDIDSAVKVFDEMVERDVSSWNSVIHGLINIGREFTAFNMFRGMRAGGLHGDRFSISTLLNAANGTVGESLHAYAVKVGVELELSVGNALVGFYTREGCVEDVVDVFGTMPLRDVISWTGMVTGYMEFGEVESAVEVFDQMGERNCVTYNAVLAGFCKNGEGERGLELFQGMVENRIEISDFTLTSVVNACSIVSDLKKSEQVHAFVIKSGCKSNARVDAALLDMCAKCGRMEDAEKLFEGWTHDEMFGAVWTSMVSAHARCGQPEEALSLFHRMLKRDDVVILDDFVLATVLGVCGTLGFGEMGMQIHCHALKSGLLTDVTLGNAIVSMYAKCWKMEDAINCFNQMHGHDIVSWNALISAYLLHRQGDGAMDAWEKMVRLGIRPDHITFVLLISACTYTTTNSLDFCRQLFLSMKNTYDIEPASEHYAAMIGILGYWDCFDEAEKLIQNMPFKPDASVWRALIDSCRLRTNLSLGRQAVQRILALEPQDTSTYVLVSNLYSASERWHCSQKVREEMHEKGLKKLPARSWIIHQSAVHSFFARDKSHPQSKDIRSGLEILIRECLKSGYEPDTSFVLHEVEECQKNDFLFHHSTKLAVAYGILMTSPGQVVRVVKNIHICGDCHTFLIHVSSVTGREISVRDATGVHSFKGGRCSCGDYW